MENKKSGGIFSPDKRVKFTDPKWDKTDALKLINRDLKITRIEAETPKSYFGSEVDGICIIHMKFGKR